MSPGEHWVGVGGPALRHRTAGDPAHPTVPLGTGRGFGLVHRPDAFVEELAARGARVARSDDRDAVDVPTS